MNRLVTSGWQTNWHIIKLRHKCTSTLVSLFFFIIFLTGADSSCVAQTVRYVGPFTNTTFDASGSVVIDITFAAGSNGNISGHINFTENPGERTLCGAGDFTGTQQGNALEFGFPSNDPDAGCGFDRVWTFTVTATLSENADVITGNYSISGGQQGIFEAVHATFPGTTGKTGVDTCSVTGDPVTLTNGNHFQQVEDIRLPGPGVPFRFVRTYNSRSEQTGPLGFGWSHNFAAALMRNADGTIIQLSGDGAQVIFTPNGDGTYASTSPPGLFRTLSETADGFTIHHKDGLTLEFTLSTSNKLTKLTVIRDRNGNTQTLSYDDSSGHLLAVSDNFGKTLNFSYEEGRITTITDMTGRVWTYTYDRDENLASVITPSDNETSSTTMFYSYFANGFNAHNLETIRDTRGRPRRFLYHASDQLAQEIDATGAVTAYIYDYATLQTQVIDPRGFDRLYTYNNEGLVLSIHESDGSETRFTWGPDENGPAGTRTSVTNRLGHTTILAYDTNGNLTTLTDPLGNTTQFVYEPVFNQVTSITDPEGNITTIGYDERGNPITFTDPLGGIRAFTYDSRSLLLTQTDANGNTTTFTYDARGHLETITNANGIMTRFTRDEVGNVINITESAIGNITTAVKTAASPEERTRSFTYDALDRLLTATDGTGAVTQFRYDIVGNLTEVENATGQTVQRTHDAMNRLIRIDDPVRGVTHLSYNASGNLIQVTDGVSQTTTFTYDERNQLVGITDAQRGQTSLTYDAQGNIVALQDALGQVTTFTYDALDRLIQRINPLGQSTAFTYDARSNLLTRTNPNDQVVSYAYDALSRLGGIITPDNTIELSYDAVGNVLAVDDNDSALRFAYDALNRLITVQTLDTGIQPAVTLTNRYDVLDNRRQLLDSAGGSSQFTYDAEDRLRQLLTPANDIIALSYDVVGRLKEIGFPNGVSSDFGYDRQGRLERLTHRKEEEALADFTYGYNSIGNIIVIREQAQPQSFLYDDLQQLLSVFPETYTYDAVGNRISSHLSTTYRYDAANRLLEEDDFDYTYDDNGNLIRKTAKSDAAVTAYAYDAENRLIRIDFPDGTFATYRYDGLGRRIEKNVNGMVTRYVYDGADILLEYDGSNILVARYSHGDRTDQPISMERAGQRYFYHTDHLGSIRTVTDTAGAEVNAYDYDGFGQLKDTIEGVANPYTFTGREQDPESGLYYYRARYYCPSEGRFISEDPLGLAAADVNLYRYVFNNPVNFTDPSGEVLPFLLIGGVLGGIFLNPNPANAPAPGEIPLEGSELAGVSGAVEGVLITSGIGQVCRLRHIGSSSIGTVAVRGGIKPVNIGKAGEKSVGVLGPKTRIRIPGTDRIRIPDRLTATTVTEVKNVETLSYTRQLRDFVKFSKETNRTFELYVRPDTRLTKPLQEAVSNGDIVLRIIP